MRQINQLLAMLAAIALATTALLGCGPPCKDAPPEDCLSEGNYLREDADPLPIRANSATGVEYELVTASVDWNERDATDWVSVKVPGAGTLTVDYNWDNPKCKCRIVITDELGAKLDAAPNKGKRATLSVSTVEGGLYFIQFKTLTEDMKSVYSAKFTWEREVIERPEPVTPVVEPEPVVTRPKPKGPRPKPKPKAPDESKLARIAKLVPGTDTDPAVITINRGSRDGITKGMTGSIVGVPGSRFKVKKVFAITCEAQVKGVTADKIKGKSKVEFD